MPVDNILYVLMYTRTRNKPNCTGDQSFRYQCNYFLLYYYDNNTLSASILKKKICI
jgi:hypothetical protein